MNIALCIWVPLLVAQTIMVFILGMFNEAGLDAVMYLGWLVWAVSLIFGWLPIVILKRKGGVPKLVEKGGVPYQDKTWLRDLPDKVK